MARRGTATFVKDVSAFFTGPGGLYKLVPPLQHNDLDYSGEPFIRVIEYIVIVDAMICGVKVGTTVYESDEAGWVTSWERTYEKAKTHTRAESLRALGYEEGQTDAGSRR